MTDGSGEHTGPVAVRLGRETLVPVGVAGSVLAGLFGFHMWLSGELANIDRRLERIEYHQQTDKQDRWTRTDHRLWALELQQMNPEITVPKPENGG